MSWSTPRTWSVGETLTAANMNTYISNDLSALRINYGTTLPGSPSDGDLTTLVDSTTNPTYQWTFRYNAGSSSSYKWEFIGGPPRVANVDTEEAPSGSGSWVNLATDGPSIVLPSGVGGDFYCSGHASAANASGGTQGALLGVAVGNTTPTILSEGNHLVGGRDSQHIVGKITSVAAASTIKLRYENSSTTSMTWAYRVLTVIPIRVG